MSCNNVQILNFNHNIVEVGSDNKLIITDNVKCNSITIPQPVTNILQINSPGPQGPTGTTGLGPNNSVQFKSGSFISGSSKFTFNPSTNTLILTGSMDITGSLTVNTINVGQNTLNFIDDNGNFKNSLSVTGNNIVIATGSLQTSGSSFFSGSFVGPLQGTASFSISSSYSITASYANIADVVANASSFVTTSSFNAFTSSYNTFSSSYNTGSFSGSFTGSLQGTSSWAASASVAISSSFAVTASYALFAANSGGSSTDTGSLLTTASVSLNTITFTKGDGSTFPITVNTGSGGTVSGDYVTTSSFNAFTSSVVTTSSFNAFTQSINTATSSFVTNVQTSSFVTNSQTSSFVQNNQTSSFVTNSQTSSFVTNSQTSSFATTSSFNSYTSSINSFTSSILIFTQSINNITGSFLTTGSSGITQTISGSLTINQNLNVLGSASITFISESTLNIGTNLITVNTINPGARFGGLAVIDSGSSPLVSASFLYDSVQDEFLFIHKGTAGGVLTSSIFLLGPETFDNVGNEIYLTANRIPKGTGIEHLNDSNISDNGSIVSINSNTQITGSLSQGLEGNIASGPGSHAEGSATTASGDYSHAEGDFTQAIGYYSHAEGQNTMTLASAQYSHAEGNNTIAAANHQHVQGQWNVTSSIPAAFIVGNGTDDSNRSNLIHAAGSEVQISGSLSQGSAVTASGAYSHAEGQQTQAYGEYSHAEGRDTIASGSYSHAEGQNTIASGSYSHAEGDSAKAIGDYSHAEGDLTQAKGERSHVEGNRTIASGSHSHAEGYLTIAIGVSSHAEGKDTQAIGNYSHAEGDTTIAQGLASHAEGLLTLALGLNSHAEGLLTTASANYSHAEGQQTQAIGEASHTEGLGTVSSGSYQHVQGQYNISSSVQSAFIIGNGTSGNNRSNLVFAAGSTFQVTGSLSVSNGITGSLQGTASWAANAITASYALFAANGGGTTINTSSFATTGSNTFNGNQTITGSFVVTGSAIITGSLTTTGNATILGLTANRALAADANNQLVSSATTATELGYLSGTTSAVQTQLDNKTYTLFFFSNAWTITAGATNYMGNFPRSPVTAAGTSRVHIPKAGTITDALFSIYSAGLAGSNNAITASIRLNNTTDYLIEQNSTAATNRTFTNNSLSIPVVVGDYIEIKMQIATPYTTVPTNNFPTANVLIRS
jgi:hypothetical protein